MTTAVREAPHHNTLTCYTNYRCRRPDCVERYLAWDRQRRAARAAGQWQPLVDAEPVRQHLRLLAEHDITLHRAAELADVPKCTLHRLLPTQHGQRRPVTHTVRADLAAKILAIDPAAATPGRVDPTGTVRRIQALVANGWPMSNLAGHIGLSPRYVHVLVARSSDCLIYGSTAAKVAAGYEEAKHLRPARHGVQPRIVKMARNLAASRGWPPASYWADRMDVIDDPHFTPEHKKLRAEIIAEEAHWLMTAGGLDRDQAAERLGIARFTVDRALREHPQDLAVATKQQALAA